MPHQQGHCLLSSIRISERKTKRIQYNVVSNAKNASKELFFKTNDDVS